MAPQQTRPLIKLSKLWLISFVSGKQRDFLSWLLNDSTGLCMLHAAKRFRTKSYLHPTHSGKLCANCACLHNAESDRQHGACLVSSSMYSDRARKFVLRLRLGHAVMEPNPEHLTGAYETTARGSVTTRALKGAQP